MDDEEPTPGPYDGDPTYLEYTVTRENRHLFQDTWGSGPPRYIGAVFHERRKPIGRVRELEIVQDWKTGKETLHYSVELDGTL